MKNISHFILLFCFLFISFQSTPKANASNENKKTKVQKISLSPTDQKIVMSFFSLNEEIHLNFFKSKFIAPANGITSLKKNVKSVKDLVVKKILEQNIVFLDGINQGKNKMEKMNYFHDFSLGLISMLEAYELGSTYKIYYCSMVQKKWVQNSIKLPKVHNPYAALEMPYCGECLE